MSFARVTAIGAPIAVAAGCASLLGMDEKQLGALDAGAEGGDDAGDAAGDAAGKLSCRPYINDDDTVLLEHFDGKLETSPQVLANAKPMASGQCCPCCSVCASDGSEPTVGYVDGASPECGRALEIDPPGHTPSQSSISYLMWPQADILSHAEGTIEFWVYATSYGGWGEMAVQRPDWWSCSGQTFTMQLNADADAGALGRIVAGIWASCNGGCDPNNPTSIHVDSGDAAVPLDTWTHVALSWGPAGYRLYLDDQLVGTHVCTGGPCPGYNGRLIVGLGSAGPAGTPGRIDELRVSKVQRSFP